MQANKLLRGVINQKVILTFRQMGHFDEYSLVIYGASSYNDRG